MLRITRFESRLLGRVVHVVLGVVRVAGPEWLFVVGIVEPVPNLNLYEDLSSGSPPQQVFEPSPILLVPLVQIVLAVRKLLERIDLEAFQRTVAHRVANIVRADLCHLVEMRFQVR